MFTWQARQSAGRKTVSWFSGKDALWRARYACLTVYGEIRMVRICNAMKAVLTATVLVSTTQIVLADQLGTAPSVSKAFTPTHIATNGASAVTLILTNPTGNVATLTSELDDHLPS